MKKYYYIWLIICFLKALLILLVTILTTYEIKKGNASDIVTLLRYEILTEDFRSVFLKMSHYESQFAAVEYCGDDNCTIIFEDQGSNFSLNFSIPVRFEGAGALKGELKFSFKLNKAVKFAFLIWIITIVFTLPVYIWIFTGWRKEEFLKNQVHLADLENIRLSQKIQISKQVAHDIRSPVAALKHVTKMLKGQAGELEMKLLNQSVGRINQIAEDLLNRKNEAKMFKSFNLDDCLKKIVEEKKLLDGNFHIEYKPFGENLFVMGYEGDLQRIISNLVNNSIEAKDESRQLQVYITTKRLSEKVIVTVKDNGIGIPKEKISELFKQGNTFGKKDGHGLGLFHAKQTLESWGGTIEITSELGVETQVLISLQLGDSH